MSRTPVVAFGHSHLGVLQSAYDRCKADSSLTLDVHFRQLWGLYDPQVRRDGDALIYNEALEADLIALVERAAPHVLVSSLLGSEHFIWAIEGQTRPFDIILPFASDLPVVPDAEIIPYRLIRQFTFQAISSILGLNRRVRELTALPVYQLLPPPPVSSQERLVQRAPETFREKMLRTRIPHWIIRYKLWLIWVEIAREVADRDMIQLVRPPADACDGNGLLLEPFCGDAVHGNEAYADLVFHQLEDLIGRRG